MDSPNRSSRLRSVPLPVSSHFSVIDRRSFEMISPDVLPRLRSRLGLVLLAGTMLWAGFGSPAAAQQTRTLDIRDGTVYVDGRALADHQLPSGLDLNGVNAHYQFVGIQRPVVELRGQLVAIADSGLTAVTDADVQSTNAAVVMQGGTARAGSAQPVARGDAAEAERSEHQQYLRDVQQSSRELYERLQRERRMEQEAQDLARVIRMLPESDAREAKTDTLRAMLNRIFEIKQENHRREIERLQRKIQELQRRLQERSKMRQPMIDHRLQQLVSASSR